MINNNKGFITLIELMIILALIGIVAAVAVPKFVQLSHQVDNAKRGYDYNYIVTTYSANGAVLDEFRVKYYIKSTEGLNMTLRDNTEVVVNGTYKIQEVNTKNQ